MKLASKNSLIEQLQQEREQLLEQERATPHEEQALAAWLMADVISGEEQHRKDRLKEIDGELFLAERGYMLFTPPPSQEDPIGNRLYLVTLEENPRVALTITRTYFELHKGPMTREDWFQLLLHRGELEGVELRSILPKGTL